MTTLTADHPALLEQQAALGRPPHNGPDTSHDTSPERQHLLDHPLATDLQLEERVMSTIGTACRHQLWFLLLTSADVQLPIALPCDDLPAAANEKQADTLLAFCAGLMADRGATQLVTVWERPGRGALSSLDAQWAQTIAAVCKRRGIQLRAQLLSHTRGVCLLSPSDLLAGVDESSP